MKIKGSRVWSAWVFLIFLAGCSAPIGSQTEQPTKGTASPSNGSSDPAPAGTINPAIAVVGPEETVFDWSKQACAPEDIPDLPARAFKDAQGQVHLISAMIVNRANLGPDLNHLTHSCDVVMNSDHNSDPSKYNDNEWIAAPYTKDGATVYAIVHEEYHGWEHNDCSSSSVDFGCWYNAVTLAVSHDGGQTFKDAAPAPANFVAGLPYPYEAGAGPYGIFEPSNILKAKDGYYYEVVKVDQYKSDNQWSCLMRTDDLSDPSSWRAWDGQGFNTQFINPYLEPDANPADHTCTAVSHNEIGNMHESLTYNEYLDRYILLGISADQINGREVWGIYYSFSDDLIHWDHRQLLWERELNWTYQPGDEKPIGYPTLLDPESASSSFDTTGQNAYLYYTLFNTSSSLDRDLVRVPVQFFKQADDAARTDTRSLLTLKTESVSPESASLNGKLETIGGIPLGGQSISILAKTSEGEGTYYQYDTSGVIPDNASQVIMGYRSNIECECSGAASEFWLYDMNFTQGSSQENLVPNSDFSKGLGDAGLFNGAEAASIEPSDMGSGNMLHVKVNQGGTSGGNLSGFNVSGGENFNASFSARVPPSSEGTGYFVVIFIGNSGEISRQSVNYQTPLLPIKQVQTNADGLFGFSLDSPLNNTVVKAEYKGDDTYLPSDGQLTITLPQ